MALNKAEIEEREGPGRAGCPTDSGDPSRPSDAENAAPAGQSSADDEARSRLDRMKFNTVKEELRRAELAFLSAKRVLGDDDARDAAHRIAEAIRRCSLSVDSVEKGAAVHHAVETLEGVSKFDPATHLPEFIRIGGRSLTLASQALASCGVGSIEYWGRQLQNLADKFAALPASPAD